MDRIRKVEMLTFLALLSLVYGTGENLDLNILIIFLYGIVTVDDLDSCTVNSVTGHGKHKGKQK